MSGAASKSCRFGNFTTYRTLHSFLSNISEAVEDWSQHGEGTPTPARLRAWNRAFQTLDFNTTITLATIYRLLLGDCHQSIYLSRTRGVSDLHGNRGVPIYQ